MERIGPSAGQQRRIPQPTCIKELYKMRCDAMQGNETMSLQRQTDHQTATKLTG